MKKVEEEKTELAEAVEQGNQDHIEEEFGDIDIFFDDSIIGVCQELAGRGVRVIIAGLDTDFLGKPFGPMPGLMAIAEDVQKVHAICVRCGSLANHSHRLSASKKLVVLGEKDTYEPLCRDCYNKAVQEDKEA